MKRIFYLILYMGMFLISIPYANSNPVDQLHSINRELQSLIDADLPVASKKQLADSLRAICFQIYPDIPTNSQAKRENYSLLTELYFKLDELEEIEDILLPLFPTSDIPHNLNHQEIGRTYYWLGNTYDIFGSYESAINYFQIAIRILNHFEDSTYLYKSYNNLALIYKRQEYYDKAIEYFAKSLDIRFVKDPKSVARVYNNMATVFIQMEELDSAHTYIDKAILSTSDSLFRHHSYANLGRIYEIKGVLTDSSHFHRKAIIEHKKALDIRLALQGKRGMSTHILNSLLNIGANYDYLNAYSDAKEYYTEALAFENENTLPSLKVKIRENLADVTFSENRYGAAIKDLVKLIESIEEGDLGEFDLLNKKYEIERLSKKIEIYRVGQMKHNQLILAILFLSLIIILGIVAYIEQNRRRNAQAKNQEILAQHSRKLAEERTKTHEKVFAKVGRELHDGIQNYIYAWQLGLCEESEKATRDKLDSLNTIVREISHQLVPALLKDGIMPSLRDLCEQLNASKTKGLQIDLHSMSVNGRRFYANVELNIYRIVQEALNNILKYAKASHVSIQLLYFTEEKEYLSLIIEDDGRGFKSEGHHTGIGLSGMKDRVEELRGTLIIESVPGKGTTILAEIPAEIKGFEA